MTTHTEWAAKGMGSSLLPVIPPLVRMSPNSRVPLKDRGKVPGMRGPNGWFSYNWREKPATPEDLAAWQRMGAGVGVRCDAFPGWDIDVSDAGLAQSLRNAIESVLGPTSPRIGRPPRMMLPCRCEPGALRGWVVKWRTAAGETEMVDLRAAGMFYVLDGLHPRGEPYAWPEGRPDSAAALPLLTDDLVARCAEAVMLVLDLFDIEPSAVSQAGAGSMAGERGTVDQAGLLAPSEDALRDALAVFDPPGDRDTWIKCGIAIKAAGGDVEDWHAWSDRWTGEPEAAADLERRFAGFSPPFAVGWPWIELQARGAGWTGGAALDFAGVAVPVAEEAIAAAGGSGLQALQPGRAFGRLRLLTLSDAVATAPRRHLLKGVLAVGEMSEWWGAPKSGKSFLLLRIAYNLAIGASMWGRRARRSRVLYVAAEGPKGFPNRLRALRDHAGDAGEWFQYVSQSVEIGGAGSDLAAVTAAAQHMRAELIVLDTLARTFGDGDENTAQDMNRFVVNVDKLRAGTDAHVAVIHHGRKDGGASRGSGAFDAAVDLIVKVTKGTSGDASAATIENAKDEADGVALPFRLQVVNLGIDEDGDPIQTCVAVESAEAARQGSKAPALRGATALALQFLHEIVCKKGEPLPFGPDMPTGNIRGVRTEEWKAECLSRGLSEGGTASAFAKAYGRAVERLQTAGCVEVRGGWVWQTAPASRSA